jgi:hypothetical protein
VEFAFPLILGTTLLGEWMVLQIPLWALAIGYGIRLRHRDDVEQRDSNSSRQFGIRQLMILTASVAIVLGVGRALFSQISAPFRDEVTPNSRSLPWLPRRSRCRSYLRPYCLAGRS